MLPSRTPLVVSYAFLLCLPLFCLFPPKFLTLKLAQIDPPCFKRSAIARPGSTNPKPKIAFLFLTNSNLSFAPLWELFFQGNSHLYNIYIHADPTSSFVSPGGIFANRSIPAIHTKRASPTLIAAERRLLAAALADDPLNLYFALLSQHCIPLHSFRFLYRTLFTETVRFPYRSFIEILSGEPNLEERYVARGETAMLPEVPFGQFRVGSQFFVLTRRHAMMVVKEKRLWRKFNLPCFNRHTCYPEEHYFPTFLSMEDPLGCTHYTLTRVNWTGNLDGHPYLYGPDEVSPELIYELRISNSTYSFMFARKFSVDSLEPLIQIAKPVIFSD